MTNMFDTFNGLKVYQYSAAVEQLAVAASPTDIFTLTGTSIGPVVPISLSVSFSGASTNSVIPAQVIIRTTANSSGTSTNPTTVLNNQTNPTSRATVLSYTANPTLGTGALHDSVDLVWGVAQSSVYFFWDFVTLYYQPLTLSGPLQSLALNLNGTAMPTTPLATITIKWLEVHTS